MNEIQVLIKEFGSYRKLAKVMGVTAPALTQMQLRGLNKVPPYYNEKILAYGAEHFTAAKMQIVENCLEHSCPTCGRPY